MTWSWAPVAILALLCLGLIIALVLDLRRDWRRVDPLTKAQLDRSVAVQREREDGR